MDRFWQTVNGTKTLLALMGIIIAGALWAYGQSLEIQRIDRYGTMRHEAESAEVERRMRRMERNIWRLGTALNVNGLEPPPESALRGEFGDGGPGGGGGGSGGGGSD